jgi:hypothetical protein
MVVPCHVPAGMRIRKLTDLNEVAEVTVKVPDSLPDATLCATPIAMSFAVVVSRSAVSVSDAPHDENWSPAEPPVVPEYWTQIAMIRSPAAGASVVRFGKVCVVLAGLVVDERRVFADVVGVVGNAMSAPYP